MGPEIRYPISDETLRDMDNKHTYHAPTDDQIERYQKIREKAKEFEEMIRELSPPGRPQAVSITYLETSVFWVNAAIARGEA